MASMPLDLQLYRCLRPLASIGPDFVTYPLAFNLTLIPPALFWILRQKGA
jgi:hypothetical protein